MRREYYMSAEEEENLLVWSSILVPTTEFNHIFLEPLGNLTLLYFFPSSFLFFVVIAFQYPKPQNL